MNRTVSHQIPVSRAKEGQLVRIDTRINRFLMKNGLERGLITLTAPGAVVTMLPFAEQTVNAFPPLFERFRQLCKDTVFAGSVRAGGMRIPVNLGQLVIGDFQHLVLIPGSEEDLTLSLTFTPTPIILKLTSVFFRGTGRILDLDAAVEKELYDSKGAVTVITPNTSCFLMELSSAEDNALLSLLERSAIPEEASFYTASYRAAIFGQCRTLQYDDGRLVHEAGKRFVLVHLNDEPMRHDLYLLQQSDPS